MPVHAATTCAISSSVTSWLQQALAGGLLVQRLLGGGELLLQFGQAAVLDLRGQVQIAAALGLFQFELGLLDLAVDDADGVDGGLFVLPLRLELRRTSPSGPPAPSPASSAARCEASSFSFFSAFCSISSCMICRSSWSISVGMESSSMRRRDAASSIRSIALSGRNRSVM